MKRVDIYGTIRYYDEIGLLHREDGPAIEDSNGDKFWYINGENINCETQEEFERLLKIKAFW